jgi:hypothetical protein
MNCRTGRSRANKPVSYIVGKQYKCLRRPETSFFTGHCLALARVATWFLFGEPGLAKAAARKGQFSAEPLRKIERSSLSRVKQKPRSGEGLAKQCRIVFIKVGLFFIAFLLRFA